MMKSAWIEPVFTKDITIKLNNFGTKQREVCRALLEAKPLGICRITTSEKARSDFRSLDSILRSGNVSMKIDIILTKNDQEEET